MRPASKNNRDPFLRYWNILYLLDQIMRDDALSKHAVFLCRDLQKAHFLTEERALYRKNGILPNRAESVGFIKRKRP